MTDAGAQTPSSTIVSNYRVWRTPRRVITG